MLDFLCLAKGSDVKARGWLDPVCISTTAKFPQDIPLWGCSQSTVLPAFGGQAVALQSKLLHWLVISECQQNDFERQKLPTALTQCRHMLSSSEKLFHPDVGLQISPPRCWPLNVCFLLFISFECSSILILTDVKRPFWKFSLLGCWYECCILMFSFMAHPWFILPWREMTPEYVVFDFCFCGLGMQENSSQNRLRKGRKVCGLLEVRAWFAGIASSLTALAGSGRLPRSPTSSSTKAILWGWHYCHWPWIWTINR